MVCCNFIAVIIYLIIFILAKDVTKNDVYTDLTIYTQASTDWGNNGWQDFVWGSNNACPEGYSYTDLSNTWLGTVEGNYTDDGGVIPTDERWKGPIAP